jgi:predicted membrane-bound spermidine synthase
MEKEKTKSDFSVHNKLLLCLSFLEGGSLMATELLSARMLAPYFGSSLFVWATVLAVTLGGLTIGYFLGGLISTSLKKDKLFLITLLYCGVMIMTMPFIAQWVLNFAHFFSFNVSVIQSGMLIILPPVIGMGMVSPLAIANLDSTVENSGKKAGLVYAISTTGGIFYTFLFGFYIIPRFGLIIPSIATGFILSIIPAILLFKNGWKKSGIFIIIFLSTLGYRSWQRKLTNNKIDVIYQKEGILGQVLVADIPIFKNGKTEIERSLFVNRIIQTTYNKDNKKFNDHAYFNVAEDVLDKFPNKSKMLLLGLGGGILAEFGVDRKFEVNAVELDQRIIEVSQKYFNLSKDITIIQDDARRFINNDTSKYNIIIFDLFRGEETPAHVFTAESLTSAKNLLSENGLLLINANGYFRNDIGKGTRSLFKTIRGLGLFVELYPTSKIESTSNMIYLVSKNRDVFDEYLPDYVKDNFLAEDQINIEDAIILTDRRPILDYLNEDATKAWRLGYMQYMNQFYKNYHIPLFN